MKYEKKYQLTNWTDWHKTLSDAIDDFYGTYSYYPIILEANTHTHSQFDFLVNSISTEKEKISKIDPLTNQQHVLDEGDNVKISAFRNHKTSVEFAIDDSISDKVFNLVYDSDPDWDNSDNIIIDPINEHKKEKPIKEKISEKNARKLAKTPDKRLFQVSTEEAIITILRNKKILYNNLTEEEERLLLEAKNKK